MSSRKLCGIFLLTLAVVGTCRRTAEAVFFLGGSAYSFAWSMPGQNANDFALWVDSPTYEAGPFPSDWWSDTFDTLAVTAQDHDADGDQDSLLHWTDSTGTVAIDSGEAVTVALNTTGAGEALDAYWTWNGSKVGLSEPVTCALPTYPSGELHVEMGFSAAFFDDLPDYEAGWTDIRAFVNVPESELGLADLNPALDLGALSTYEVQPHVDGPAGAPILPSDVIWETDAASHLDVFLTDLSSSTPSADLRTLLVADVLIQDSTLAAGSTQSPTAVGRFWSLNSQIPEPATIGLFGLGVGALALTGRRRH